MFFRGDAPFIVKLNDFNWEQVFVVAKKELDNGKLDIKFKPSEESKFSYNIIVYNSKTINFGTMKINFTDKIKNVCQNIIREKAEGEDNKFNCTKYIYKNLIRPEIYLLNK